MDITNHIQEKTQALINGIDHAMKKGTWGVDDHAVFRPMYDAVFDMFDYVKEDLPALYEALSQQTAEVQKLNIVVGELQDTIAIMSVQKHTQESRREPEVIQEENLPDQPDQVHETIESDVAEIETFTEIATVPNVTEVLETPYVAPYVNPPEAPQPTEPKKEDRVFEGNPPTADMVLPKKASRKQAKK